MFPPISPSQAQIPGSDKFPSISSAPSAPTFPRISSLPKMSTLESLTSKKETSKLPTSAKLTKAATFSGRTQTPSKLPSSASLTIKSTEAGPSKFPEIPSSQTIEIPEEVEMQVEERVYPQITSVEMLKTKLAEADEERLRGQQQIIEIEDDTRKFVNKHTNYSNLFNQKRTCPNFLQ